MTELFFVGALAWLALAFLGLMILLFPLFALIDVVKSEFYGNDKLVWVLIIIFIPFIGAILWFTIGRDKRMR